MRTLVAVTSLCSLGFLASCVNLDKPALVAACEEPEGCPNSDGGLDAPQDDLEIGQDESSDQSAEETETGVRLDGAPDRIETGAPDGPQPGPDGPAAGPDTIPNTDTLIVTVPDTAPPVLDAAAEVPVDVQPDADEGDVPSVLNGTCLYNGKPARAGTVCRLATQVCDVSEICDGISTACPLDKFVAATEVCRPKAGDCDVAEYCTGTSAACPVDKLLAKSAGCRSAVSGGCDVAEYCDGTHPVCPADTFAPATTQCRASADIGGVVCDPPEFCTGTSNACPADAKYTRPAAAPTGVAVAPGTLQADVSWTPITGDAGTGVTGYNVKSSSISTGGWNTRGSPTTSPFTVPITAGQTFYFVVSAYAGLPTCESANSSPVSAQSCSAVAPTTLTAAADSAGNVTLTWTAVSGVASYNVSRSTTKGSGYSVVASGLSASATSYQDSPPIPTSGSATFYYVVRANTGNCNSPYSPEATATIASARRDAAAD
jgi:hypothetical protein